MLSASRVFSKNPPVNIVKHFCGRTLRFTASLIKTNPHAR